MMDSVIAQHHPAIKVAGRRLSLTTKHRPHRPEETSSTQMEETQQDNDYPRPSATSDAPTHHEHGHNNYEEEAPHKKEKKTKEHLHWKSEITRPTRDYYVGQKTLNIRISQPIGKGFSL